MMASWLCWLASYDAWLAGSLSWLAKLTAVFLCWICCMALLVMLSFYAAMMIILVGYAGCAAWITLLTNLAILSGYADYDCWL